MQKTAGSPAVPYIISPYELKKYILSLQKQFYNNLESVEKMPLEAAFKQYIPDNSVNRGRAIRCLMNEKGIEATSKNFETYYNQVLENGTFEKLLAQTENKKTKQYDELSQLSAIKTQDKSRNN